MPSVRSALQTALQPLAPTLAFVDVETTGAAPDRARMTEIAIVTVQWPAPAAGPPLVEHWSHLINPGQVIPPEIRFLTGIDQSMVADAPCFADLAPEIEQRLSGALFVAHHARFDYGFIKAEMTRAGYQYQAKTLCTVRLSRAMSPTADSHTLDAIVLRHRLRCLQRHRALGDAEVLWQFMQKLVSEHGESAVFNRARALVSRPNLPSHLNVPSLDSVPAAPGIYFFHGLNQHPLYIGKSLNIRQRIANHFCTDYQSERGLRLSSETRRLSWQETAGEFSALLAEIQAIEQFRPAHNRALRNRQQNWFAGFEADSPQPVFYRITEMPSDNAPARHAKSPGGLLGAFPSRAAARTRLIDLAREFGWCLASMGLEKAQPGSACFARQLGRCAGACVGEQSGAALAQQIETDLQGSRLPEWPAARLLLVEHDELRARSCWHLFDYWWWLGSSESPEDLQAYQCSQVESISSSVDESAGPPTMPQLNRHVLSLLLKTLFSRKAMPTQIKAPSHLSHLPDFDDDDLWTHQPRRGAKQSSRLSWCWLARPDFDVCRKDNVNNTNRNKDCD
ncbi:MAG: exonuclease domain-containing protein [Burkholderiaceae bacterium]